MVLKFIKKLSKLLFSILPVALTTGILSSSLLTNQNPISYSRKNSITNADLPTGIRLSSYSIKSWVGQDQKIALLDDDGNPIVLPESTTASITWTTTDSSIAFVEAQPDVSGWYTIKFVTGVGKSVTLTATYIDPNGNKHESSCVATVINPFEALPDKQSAQIKNGETCECVFQLSDQQGTVGDYSIVTDSPTYSTFFSYTIDKDATNKTVTLKVTANSSGLKARTTFKLIHSSEASKSEPICATFDVLIVSKTLSVDKTNFYAKQNDTVTISAYLDGTLANDGEVQWEIENNESCYIQEGDKNKATPTLTFLKPSTTPVEIQCHSLIPTDEENEVKSYLNLSSSVLKITNKPSRTTFKLSEKGLSDSFTITLDGIPILNNIYWATSDASVACVSSTGKVTFLKPGTVTISVLYKAVNFELSDSITFTIELDAFTTVDKIQALISEAPKKIVAKMNDIDVDTSKLSFEVEPDEQGKTCVSIDATGQLKYLSTGKNKVHCHYIDFYDCYDSVTEVTIIGDEPTKEYTLEWYEKRVGSNENPSIHNLPKAFMGGIEIPLSSLVWTSSSSKVTLDGVNGTFAVTTEGNYTLTCSYTWGEQTFTKEVLIIVQDYFVNHFIPKEPTITSDATTFIKSRTFQLEFWFDDARTQRMEIKSCRSTKPWRAEVDDKGFITFKGHGKCDIICTLIYVTPNDEPVTIEATVHLSIVIWWWVWLILGIIVAAILFLIIFFSARKAKKNEKQIGGSGKKSNKDKASKNKKTSKGKK